MIQTPAKQIKSLASAVTLAFSRACLTPEEANNSVLVYTDLPWSNPPLLCDSPLDGVPLQWFLDTPMDVRELYAFWRTTLGELWHRKRHLIHKGAFTGLRFTAPKSSLGQRALRFSTPGGFPSEMGDMVGAEFSLEAAHTALISCAIKELVSDESNYYVVTAEGHTIGVKDGIPATPSDWDIPVTGMVQEMLRMTRGNADYTCMYDHLARSRSLLHEYRNRFPDFGAVDYALQALRKLSLGAYCPALVASALSAPLEAQVLEAKALAMRQALDVMQADINDRAKIRTLEELLVPLVVKKTVFAQRIYNINQPIPFAVRPEAMTKIATWLNEYYETKIPEKMRTR